MVPDRYRGRVNEARLEDTTYGRGPVSDGWFVVNVRDAAWMHSPKFGSACVIETDDVSFPQIGFTIAVLHEGGSSGLYHREDDQEDFLVLSGECIAIVEGEERRMGPGDFLHSPPGTAHITVGAGDGPCVILMVGTRGPDVQETEYTVDELAARYGASVARETTSSKEAYADLARDYTAVPAPWPPRD